MRTLLATLLLALASPVALADEGQLVADSDTGIVFGDLDCRILTHATRAPEFFVDEFDYLRATVQVDTTCVTRTGDTFTSLGEDTVGFFELRFDWLDQAWYAHDTLIAKRVGWRQVEMNPDLDYPIWTSADEVHVAFRVEARERP